MHRLVIGAIRRPRERAASMGYIQPVAMPENSKVQQTCGVAPNDQALLIIRQSETIQEAHGLLIAHVEAIVAAKHEAVRPNVPNEKVKGWAGVRDRIVAKPAQVAAGLLCQALRFRTHRPARIDPPDKDWQSATRVRQGEVQRRILVQHPAQNQMGRSDRGIERIAEQVAQIEVGQSRAAPTVCWG